jgi:hypothetical protein
MLRVIEDLAGDWRRLDERIEDLSGEIDALAHHDKGCERLMTVPGVGPIISSAIVAAIGTGDAFSKGRDFGAWLGLVPKQMSTGDRTILGSISRRGNRYLRKLFVQAAWVVLVKLGPEQWERYGLKSWIEAAKKRLHHNVLAIALANKLARIASPTLDETAGSSMNLGRTPTDLDDRVARAGGLSDIELMGVAIGSGQTLPRLLNPRRDQRYQGTRAATPVSRRLPHLAPSLTDRLPLVFFEARCRPTRRTGAKRH